MTKLFIPSPRPDALPRADLVARLNAGLHRRLTLISAPAGFGKTSLAGAWIGNCGRPAAWLSLDATDSDPARFLIYLVAALQTLVLSDVAGGMPAIGADVVALLRSAQPPRIDALLPRLLNQTAALPQPALLVLDDYHLLAGSAIDPILSMIVAHLPPQLHLVLLTREDPSLPLPRLRARGHLTELRAADLRFTSSEAAAFLTRVMGLDLAADDLATLEARTEGWVAGLQLAALSLQGRDDAESVIATFSGNHRFVLDYLLEEVLHRQSPSIQNFLLRTAILDRLCGPLCDAVLADASLSGQAALEFCERANLFLVPLDDERRWYRYHHLFAEVLRQRLNAGTAPAQVVDLYRRAAAAEPSLEQAVAYLLYAELWDEAATRIVAAGDTMLLGGQHALLQSWIERVPEAVRDALPRLHTLLGIVAARQGLLGVAERALVRGHDGHRARGDQPGQAEALAELALVALLGGDPGRCLALADTALNLSSTPAIRVGLLILVIGVDASFGHGSVRRTQAAELFTLVHDSDDPQILGRVLTSAHTLATLFPDQLDHLELLCRRGLARFAGPMSMTQLGARAGLMYIALLRGRLDEAEASSAAVRQAELALEGMMYLGPQCLGVLASVAIARGDLVRAEEFATQALCAAGDMPLYTTAIRYPLARIHWQRDNIAELRVLAAQLATADDLHRRGIALLAQALVAIAEGDATQAAALLRRSADEERERPILPVIGNPRPLMATLALHEGREAEALAIIAPLLAACAQDATPGRLMLEGPYIIPLLRLAAARSPHAAFAARTLDLLEAQRATHQAQRAVVGVGSEPSASAHSPQPATLREPLSARELEVLHLLAVGYSNRRIADSLVIAVGTVKRHVSNIAGKLEAESRLAAVARARELGLL